MFVADGMFFSDMLGSFVHHYNNEAPFAFCISVDGNEVPLLLAEVTDASGKLFNRIFVDGLFRFLQSHEISNRLVRHSSQCSFHLLALLGA